MKTLKDYPLQSLSTQELSQIDGGFIPPIPTIVMRLIDLLFGDDNND